MPDLRERLRSLTRLVRWLFTTPWPAFALDQLRSNIVGAVFVFAFLRFALPVATPIELQTVSRVNQILFGSYLIIAMLVGTLIGIRLTLPILIWHRRRAPDDPKIRQRALDLPKHMVWVQATLWFIGGVIFVLVNLRSSYALAATIALTVALGATTTCALGYMQAERVLRPITVSALADDPEGARGFSVATRITLSWVVATAVPLVGIIAVVVASKLNLLDHTRDISNPILVLSVVALGAGMLGMFRVAQAISDPIKQLFRAQQKVRDGDFSVALRIYDSSEVGLLQAGFNDMVHDLAERQRMRDMFGRYVGEDVARRALEHGTELGGGIRDVGVLFVDLVGSTRLALTTEPSAVVALLNDFFEVVVEAVARHGGFVNKFQGDAALAIFGAPLDVDDYAGAALAAARDMRGKLQEVLGGTGFGIGVAAGQAIAGHIGAQARFEYTVIGDPVNEAARITDLAKAEPALILASGAAVSLADEEEAALWKLGEDVVLRGRGRPTTLARPIAPLETPSH